MYKTTIDLFDTTKHCFEAPTKPRGNYGMTFKERTITLDDGYVVLLQMTGCTDYNYITFCDKADRYVELCYIAISDHGETSFMMGDGQTHISKKQFYDLVKGFSFSAMEWLLWNLI